MYEYNGQQYTLDQVQEAAANRNMSLDDYVNEFGLTKILESSPDFQTPTIPGAVVGAVKAPATESKSATTSSDSRIKFNVPGIPIPLQVNLGDDPTDDMTYEDIFVNEINNLGPSFSKTWQDFKVAAVDWYRQKGYLSLGGPVGSQAAKIASKIPAVKSFRENALDFLFKNLIYNEDKAIDVKDATEKFMIDTYNKSVREQDKIKSVGSLTGGIAEGDLKQFTGGAAQTIRSLITTMIPAIATRGASIYPQISGQMYTDYNLEKAKQLYGDSPDSIEKLINNNRTEVTVPMTLAGIASAAEFAGMKGITRAITKNVANQGVKKLVVGLFAANNEGGTELFQTGVETYNNSLAQNKSATEAAEDAFNIMFSDVGLESYVQGAFGSGITTTAGTALKKAYITAREQGGNMGIVPNNMQRLAQLRQERLETSDEVVQEGIDKEIDRLTEQNKKIVQESNDIVNNSTESEITVLADAQTALELYKTRVSTLTAKLEAGEITQEQYDLALTGFVNEYKQSQEAAKKTISDVSNKNRTISDKNSELIATIKNPDSSEANITRAKNELVQNNLGFINQIVNANFDPTKDTTLTREDLLAEVNLAFSDLINTYNIDSGVPFGAYIRQNLPRRLPAMFEKLVETKPTEEGKREIIAKQDISEIQIEDTVEQAEIDQPTITKLKNELNIDDSIVNRVISAVKKVFGTSLPAVTDKSFKKELTTSFKNELTDLVKKDGIFGKDSDEFNKFIRANAKAIYNALPLEVMTKTFKPFVEKQIDPETGKALRERTAQGKNIFIKKEFDSIENDFINYFTDPNLGSSTRSDRKTSIAKQIADQLARDEVVDVLLDPEVSQKFKDIQELEGKEVPEDFLDRIVRSIDRGLEFLNKIQKSDNLYVGLGFPELAIQSLKVFLQTAKISVQATKSFSKALERGITAAQQMFDNKEDKSLIKEIITDNYQNESDLGNKNVLQRTVKQIDSLNHREENFKQVEEKYLKFQNESKDLKSNQTEAPANLNNKIDLNFEINDKKIGVEIKKNAKARFGTPGRIGGNIDKSINELNSKNSSLLNKIWQSNLPEIKKVKAAINKWKNAAEKLEKKKITKFPTFKLKDENITKLQNQKLQANVEKIKVPVSMQDIRDFYKGKDKDGFAGEYMIIDDKLYSLGYDPLKTGAPLLEGDAVVEFVLKRDNGQFAISTNFRIKKISNISNVTLADAQKFNNTFSNVNKVNSKQSEELSQEFNEIIEETKGVDKDEIFSEAQGRNMGRRANRFKVFVPYSAEDLLGLLYRFAGKGKQGDKHLKWIKDNITRPLTESYIRFENAQQSANNYLKEAKEIIKNSGIDLSKEVFKGYTNDQIIRIHIWSKRGYDLSKLIGMKPDRVAEINKFVRKNFKTLDFIEAIEKAYTSQGQMYPAPDKEWITGTLTTDLLNFTNTISRAEAFEPFYNNIDGIFGKFDKATGKLSGDNLNKIKALYGTKFVKALESSLYRISTGRNKSYQLDQQGNSILNWLNNSIGTIMFFNTRSALLQTISNVNFTNWTDNNPFMLMKAWSNQPQFWKDFAFLFNSDYLKSRRSGLKTDVQEQEIATAAAQSSDKVKAAVATILKKGFLPTQFADSFAIALGGASFYRNRINSYKKNGLSQQEAEAEAFNDFREISEETQQSSRPDKISMEQAGFAGRLILAFQNTPLQYNRLAKKAGLDLINGRGDIKTNISKIIYYLGVQNAIFYSLQQALFSIYFGDEEEEKEKDRYFNVANGMADSILRGSGVYGALISTLKNATIETIEQTKKKNPQFINTIKELSGISPPLNSKFRKLLSIDRRFRYKQELEKIKTLGADTKNPAILSAADALSVGFNLPADRVLRKINNLRTALEEETELWQSIALAMGYSTYDVGINEFKNSSDTPNTTGLKKPKKRKRGKPKNKVKVQ